ncbi:Protein NLP1 [Zea mays]|uniref:Protein NLP1 n=2 Tax=Zea mays TaxID=4577 RepID=A0A3L6FGY2_MAIZE|nr:Protein NLP1 [Zea mays]
MQSDGDVLVQLWVPVNHDDGKLVLTTSEQPFTLDHRSDSLLRFREVSTKYQFSADVKSGGFAGAAREGLYRQAPRVVAEHQVLHQLRVSQGKGCTIPRCPWHHGSASVREGKLQLTGRHQADHDKAEDKLHF